MATGTTNEWQIAAANAEDAAYKADGAAFAAEQNVLESKAAVYRAQLAIQNATSSRDQSALDAAKQQLIAAENSVVTTTSTATQLRQQSDNANKAFIIADEKAAANASSPTLSATPPPASSSTGSPTAYQNIPSTITPVTAPSPKTDNTFSSSNVTTASYTTTTSVVVENTTGGGSVTTYIPPSIPTPQSMALQSQADVAQKQADLLSLNPNTIFGVKALDKKLANGTISQSEYDYVKGLSNEQRIAEKTAASTKASDLRTQSESASIQPPPTVTTTQNLDTTTIEVTNIQSKSISQSTTINGEVSGYNVSTQTVDGVQYQVTNNAATASTTYSTPSDSITLSQPVEPDNTTIPSTDPVSSRADENNGFVFDPATGEMIPGDSSLAAELIEIDVLSDPLLTPDGGIDGEGDTSTGLEEPVAVDPENEPLRTPDGGIDGEGDTSTGLEEPVAVDPENEPLRTPDGGIDDEGDAGTGLEEPPIDPDDDPAVRALMESSRQEAEDNFEFGDAPNTDDFGPPPPQKETPPPPAAKDWRVRISLAQGAKYFYASDTPGILRPLASTGGVVFPYTPSISVSYTAKYDPHSLTHTNYSFHNYTGSSVDQITITGDFTAQDTSEAAYMLAVIHFFRSATKMFYGQDENPKRGTPPPLLYLSGHGNYQFDNHPMVLTNFSYALPTDVDYINAYPDGSGALNTMPLAPYNRPNTAKPSPMQRLTGSGLQPGGTGKKPIFVNSPSGVEVVTRVPTKISISLNFLPIVTRNAITNKFSLKKYASGELLRGSQNPGTGGGIW